MLTPTPAAGYGADPGVMRSRVDQRAAALGLSGSELVRRWIERATVVTDRECAIRERADAILRELVAVLESEPDRLDAVDVLILALRGIGIRATRHPGEPVKLSLANVAVLVDGAAALARTRPDGHCGVRAPRRRSRARPRQLVARYPALTPERSSTMTQ